MVENYKFFQNNKCEYFPCHKNIEKNKFNCIFCFCPLYLLGINCEGEYKILENGIKSCECCKKVHYGSEAYDNVMKIIQEKIGDKK